MANAKHDVIRNFTVVDSLPINGPRASVLEDSLVQVKETVPDGKFVCIAEYTTPAAASGAAQNLRRRHGSDETVDGWNFVSRKLDNGRSGLFVRHDGSKIVAGKMEAQKEEYETWKAEQAAKAKAAAAKKAAAKANGGSQKPAPKSVPATK